MAEFFVKTYDNRNLVIEADSYDLDYTQTAYKFTKDSKTVATVPANPNLFAIIDNDAEKSDHYYVYDWNEEDDKENSDDVCLDCRFKGFLESEEFFSEVWGIVDAYHEPDDLPTIYFTSTPVSPNGSWGFRYTTEEGNDVFVPFGTNRADAEEGLRKHEAGKRDWFTHPLSETTPVPEKIQ